MKIINKIFLIAPIFLMCSCATIFSGKTQNLHVKVIDEATNQELQDCKCILKEPNGTQYTIASNPGTVAVSRGSGAIEIICKKEGYIQHNTSVADSFNGTTIANVLFWPGFIVDAASGAYKKYPSHYVVNMSKIPNFKSGYAKQ